MPNWILVPDLWLGGLNEFFFLRRNEKIHGIVLTIRFSQGLEETIYKVIRYRPLNIKRWLSGKMTKDLTRTINAMRCIAVGRCRERLDQAARKAKDLLKNGQQEQKEKIVSGEEKYGVTSFLKRRHGL
jgi:hypothetical protein